MRSAIDAVHYSAVSPAWFVEEHARMCIDSSYSQSRTATALGGPKCNRPDASLVALRSNLQQCAWNTLK